MENKIDKRQIIVLGLGSNLGDKYGHLQNSISQLSKKLSLPIAKSSVYKTEAWGETSLNEFYNMVVCFKAEIGPNELLKYCKQIENKIGRAPTKGFNYENRVIDIDILFLGELVYEDELITIPHKHISERNFVLLPLAEILPKFEHPKFKVNVAELLAQCKDNSKVEKVVK